MRVGPLVADGGGVLAGPGRGEMTMEDMQKMGVYLMEVALRDEQAQICGFVMLEDLAGK
jgi:hypothetical protein